MSNFSILKIKKSKGKKKKLSTSEQEQDQEESPGKSKEGYEEPQGISTPSKEVFLSSRPSFPSLSSLGSNRDLSVEYLVQGGGSGVSLSGDSSSDPEITVLLILHNHHVSHLKNIDVNLSQSHAYSLVRHPVASGPGYEPSSVRLLAELSPGSRQESNLTLKFSEASMNHKIRGTLSYISQVAKENGSATMNQVGNLLGMDYMEVPDDTPAVKKKKKKTKDKEKKSEEKIKKSKGKKKKLSTSEQEQDQEETPGKSKEGYEEPQGISTPSKEVFLSSRPSFPSLSSLGSNRDLSVEYLVQGGGSGVSLSGDSSSDPEIT
ncbi:uncharacterized protein LOC103520757, partial [Diaphorina citri]|uniref:Uncharacterized protein LOC103520757 n=1 Tax=Diaphorina citri TaxID=121845 RepID=A0A1S3DL47_DIACI